jgi:hypothetical protein
MTQGLLGLHMVVLGIGEIYRELLAIERELSTAVYRASVLCGLRDSSSDHTRRCPSNRHYPTTATLYATDPEFKDKE